MKIKILIGITFSFMCASQSYAGDWTTGFNEIRTLYPAGNGNVLVRFDVNAQDDSGVNSVCTYKHWYLLEASNNGFDTIYSLLLAAKFSDASVQLFIDGCVGSYPEVQHARIE